MADGWTPLKIHGRIAVLFVVKFPPAGSRFVVVVAKADAVCCGDLQMLWCGCV